MRTNLGVAVGASLSPEVVGRVPQMAVSVALIPIYIAAISGAACTVTTARAETRGWSS